MDGLKVWGVTLAILGFGALSLGMLVWVKL